MPPAPTHPPTATPLYKTLHTTALTFVTSLSLHPTSPTRISTPLIRAIRTPTFRHVFGHNFFVSLSPFSASLDTDGFIAHVSHIVPALQSWEIEVTGLVVDEVKREVVCRCSYWMGVKGGEGGKATTVENDLVWWLSMCGDGDEMKVDRAVEFVDSEAGKRIMELVMQAKGMGEGGEKEA
ncbi:hypothetical protein BCR34DRAFT_601434 [Clohesyomyces aquaticus]|uniref:Uncharacterized protein n=1 Tax=Clohesyomyces aquaticus TaxID=1231657 RepID=A0A1Y1ZM81_9PLEO|nr:hypothetical protein BCR34DRAFT_601434 [Clohesyomyces aquaticus]